MNFHRGIFSILFLLDNWRACEKVAKCRWEQYSGKKLLMGDSISPKKFWNFQYLLAFDTGMKGLKYSDDFILSQIWLCCFFSQTLQSRLMAVAKKGKIKQNFKNHRSIQLQACQKLLASISFTLILLKYMLLLSRRLATTLIMFMHVLFISRSLCTVTQRGGVIYLNPMSFSQWWKFIKNLRYGRKLSVLRTCT